MKKKIFMLLALVATTLNTSAYDLMKGSSEHGSIAFSVDGAATETADEGQTVTVTITPNDGWAVNQPSGQWYAAMAKAPRRTPGIDLLNSVELTPVQGTENTWTFTMERANVEISATYKKLLTHTDITIQDIDDLTYNEQAQEPTVTVKDGETTLTLNTDYTVTYSNNTNAAASTAEAAPTVTITAVATSEKYAGETSVTFTILPAKISDAVLAKARFTYNAEEQTAPVRFVKAGTLTVPEDGYDVEGNTQTNAGQYTAIITGKGNFTGKWNRTFTIDPATITAVTLAQTEFLYDAFNPQPQTAEVESVKAGELDVPAEGYTIEDNTQTELGEYTVTVTGKDNFTGTLTATFRIVKGDLCIAAKKTESGEEVEGVTMQVTVSDEAVRIDCINIPEALANTPLTLTLPAKVNGVPVTELAAGMLADAIVSDVYMPDTEKPLTIGESALPATTTIHTTLSLLDDYALMPTLKQNYEEAKIMTTEIPWHTYWTLGIGCDVIIPKSLNVYTVHHYMADKVEIFKVSEELLNIDGQLVVKHNNAVLLEGNPQQSYEIVAYNGNMQSGTAISTTPAKDYDEENVLEPVIVSADYRNTDYYRLEKNAFHFIPYDLKLIPAGRALLKKPADAADDMDIFYFIPLTLDETEDNSDVLAENNGHEAIVTLKRTLQTGSWNTFAVPFDIDAETLSALGDVKVKELSSSSLSDGTLTLTFADAQGIEAGKPYLVKVAKDIDLSAQAFKVMAVSADIIPTETDAVDFIPTLGKTTVEGDKESLLFLGAENKLFYATELPADMKGFRAYFQLKGYATGAVEVRMELGTETSIRAIDNGQPTMDSIYDLSGRRIANGQLKKGVYVKSGRKVIVK